MTTKASLTGKARRQLDAALDWYLDNSPEQANRFLDFVDDARQQIADWPSLGTWVSSGSRRIRTKVFPYNLWYIIKDGRPLVIAVTHFRQDTEQLRT